MTWVEAFAVLLVSHLAGDFLLQTEWQAKHKFGGLGADPTCRRALREHLLSYSLALAPALVWIGVEQGVAAIWVALVVVVPHYVQDDGRLLVAYMRRVKHTDAGPGDLLFMLVDQSFHVVLLLFAALLAGVG